MVEPFEREALLLTSNRLLCLTGWKCLCCSVNGPFCQCSKNSLTERVRSDPCNGTWSRSAQSDSKTRRVWWRCNTGGRKERSVKVQDNEWINATAIKNKKQKEQNLQAGLKLFLLIQSVETRVFSLQWFEFKECGSVPKSWSAQFLNGLRHQRKGWSKWN